MWSRAAGKSISLHDYQCHLSAFSLSASPVIFIPHSVHYVPHFTRSKRVPLPLKTNLLRLSPACYQNLVRIGLSSSDQSIMRFPHESWPREGRNNARKTNTASKALSGWEDYASRTGLVDYRGRSLYATSELNLARRGWDALRGIQRG